MDTYITYVMIVLVNNIKRDYYMKKSSYYLASLILGTVFLMSTNVFAEDLEPEPNYEPEPTFVMTFDFNGGATFDGQDTLSREGVSFAPVLNEPFLVSCIDYDAENDECHSLDIKKGKVLDYVTVNDVRYEYDVDDGFMFNQDTTIKYFWTDEELVNYVVEDEDGNSITFDEESDHQYSLNVNRFSFSMTDEELEELEIDKAEYEAGKAAISSAVSEYGPVVLYLEIEVFDEENRPITAGPFDIKIKYTEDMAGYDSYKLVYVELNDDGTVTVEEGVTLTLNEEGTFLVGTLNHLSGYALVGINNVPAAPDTGNFTSVSNASLSFFAVIGTLVMVGIAVALKKRQFDTVYVEYVAIKVDVAGGEDYSDD